MSPEIDAQDIVRGDVGIERSPAVLSRRVGAAWLVTTVDDAELHELLGGAALLWEKLEKTTTVDELTALMGVEGTVPGDLPAQVRSVVEALRKLGIVRETCA